MKWTDAQLIRRLQNKDPAAFESVVEANYQLVYRQLWHFCGDAEVAADLTQETFARAWSSLDTFAGKSSIRTWLYTIAVRCWYRWKEGRAREQTSVSLDEWAESVPDEAGSPAHKLEVEVTREEVQAALGKLPSPFHETVVLFYLQNLKYREVAEVMDVSIGTVKSRLHQGLRRLKATLKESEAAEKLIVQGHSPCAQNLKSI